MDQLFVGIDSGTQGVKAVILSTQNSSIIAQGYASHEMIENQEGKREQDPQWWIRAVDAAVFQALDGVDPKQVCAMGVSGQQHGMVPLDKKGRVLHPAKLWCDTETADQNARLIQKLGGAEKTGDLIGNSMAVGFTASKVLWLKEAKPELYSRLSAILLPHDYLNYWLTGEKKTECGDASGTAYFDVRTRKWRPEVLDAIDETGKLRSCLPELIPSQEPIGKIRPEIAERFSFPRNTLVSSGGGDNMMAAIGAGNVTNGVVTASLGTSGTIYAFSDKPITDPENGLAAFCSSDNHWLPLICTMNVTVATELFRNLLNLDIQELNRLAASAPVGSEGLLLLPYFQGERTPALPSAKASLYGMDTLNLTQANLCRAAMEGASFGLRYGLEILKKNSIQPKEIRLVGGGAKSPIWREILANILDCPVICPENMEAGALGAALQAAWCFYQDVPLKELCDRYVRLDPSTRCEPTPNITTQYQEIYKNYLKMNNCLKPLY